MLKGRCDGGHRHVQLIGKSACTQAAQCPPGLCSAIVKGIQVIRKSLDELASAREKILRDGRQEPGGRATITGAGSSVDYLDACAEDLLYECELEDMCEEEQFRNCILYGDTHHRLGILHRCCYRRVL